MSNLGNAIEVTNLVKRYKDLLALDHFSLTVKEGEILGLLERMDPVRQQR